jgi:hypothetical protein
MTRYLHSTWTRFLAIGSIAVGLGGGCAASPATEDGDAIESASAAVSTATLEAGADAICSPEKQALRLQKMVLAPIKLPNRAARLDMGANEGAGLTLDDVTDKLCQGTDIGDLFGDGNDAFAFGNFQEVQVEFMPASGGIAVTLVLNQGYLGELKFKNRQDEYVITVGGTILKNGLPFLLDWPIAVQGQADELWRALSATFVGEPAPAPGTCEAAGQCVIGQFGNAGFLFFPTLGFGFIVADITAGQPVESIPIQIQMFKT